MRGLEQAKLIWRLAWRNVRLQRGKSLIVGAIFLFGTALVVVANATVDAMDKGMATSIINSLAGHLQIYSKDARDKLAIYGDEFAGMPDFGVMADFGRISEVVGAVPGVKAVVPMGSQIAMAAAGNELDRRLAELRAAVQAGDAETVRYRTDHIRQLIALVGEDLETAQALAAKTAENQKQVDDVKRAMTDAFWAEFAQSPLPALEFLENRIAPLQSEGAFIGMWYLGTDLDQFAAEFPLFEIVEGQMVPEGARGFLFNQGFYEEIMKNIVARELDELLRAHGAGKRIADDPKLRSRQERAVRQFRRVLFQLDPKASAELTTGLRGLLGREDGALDALLKEFLAVDDDTIVTRHAWFYEHIAPHIELYGVKVGDEVTLRSFTKGGYARALNVKVWGTFRFKGLERSMISKQHNLVDLISFRDLFGFMTPERRREIAQLRAKVGVSDVVRADAEDALFGGDDDDLVEDVAPLVAAPKAIELAAARDRETPLERFTKADINDGLALHAAVILKDGSPQSVAAHLVAVQAALDAADLNVQVADWQQASGMIGQMVVMVRVVLFVMIILLAVVALVVVNNAMVMATMERTREIGTMRAIGASRKFVTRLFMTETLALGLVSGALGAGLGAVIVKVMASVGIPATNEFTAFMFSGEYLRPELKAQHLVLAFVTIVVVGVLSTFYPARLAARIAPAEAMRGGDA